MILDLVQAVGMGWMDPTWWLNHFGQEFVWISLGVIFVECGLFFPFLPGDTLLFAMGLFIATDKITVVSHNKFIDILVTLVVLGIGAFLGNVSGYEIGRKIGPPLMHRNGRILKKKYFDETHEFFEKHGNSALVIGRFVPFVRTYVTVIAGVARMERRRFFVWSGVGAGLWVTIITLLGYLLGKRFPGLGNNIDKSIFVLLALSVIPIGYEWLKRRRQNSATAKVAAATPAAATRATTVGTEQPTDSDVEV